MINVNIGIWPTWKQIFPPADCQSLVIQENVPIVLFSWKFNQRIESFLKAKIGRSQLCYYYKLQIRADLKDTLNCAAILQNIIWSRLGTQFHLRYRFTCLFARILRQRIKCRNRMAWELSPWVYLPIATCFGSNEKSAKRGCRSILERTRSRPDRPGLKITITRAIMPVIFPFVALIYWMDCKHILNSRNIRRKEMGREKSHRLEVHLLT